MGSGVRDATWKGPPAKGRGCPWTLEEVGSLQKDPALSAVGLRCRETRTGRVTPGWGHNQCELFGGTKFVMIRHGSERKMNTAISRHASPLKLERKTHLLTLLLAATCPCTEGSRPAARPGAHMPSGSPSPEVPRSCLPRAASMPCATPRTPPHLSTTHWGWGDGEP